MKLVGFTSKTRHLQNRTSVEIYSNTGTVLQVVVFLYSDRKNGLRDGPKSGISSGNVAPNAKIKNQTSKNEEFTKYEQLEGVDGGIKVMENEGPRLEVQSAKLKVQGTR